VLQQRYRLVKHLGAGGMGSVWLAEDLQLERPVALKALHRPAGGGTELAQRRERVSQEARALARVKHDAIVPIHDLFFLDDDPWIVMEYISGRSLSAIVAEGPVDERELARMGRHLVRGLAAAHRAGIVHRDVKPANILVDRAGRVFLVDFGIARISGAPSLTGQHVVGTLEYLAPERLTPGAKVGPPADVWALGVTLFHALEGHPPFRSFTNEGQAPVVAAILHDTPKPRRNGQLADIILRMLVKDPGQRATLPEVYEALAAIAGARKPPVTPGNGSRRMPRNDALATPDNAQGTRATARVPMQTTRLLPRDDQVPEEILRAGPSTSAALLLAMDVRQGARILASCQPRQRGEILQSIAAAESAAAAKILCVLPAAAAGSAFGYLRPQTAAMVLSVMPGPEVARLLSSTDVRAAASAMMELPTAQIVTLLVDLRNAGRAAAILTHATSQVALSVVAADPGLGATLLPHVPEPLRTQARLAITDVGGHLAD
jgi:predicted Ser/Thr protein kinase